MREAVLVGILALDEERVVAEDNEQRQWVAIQEPALVAGLDQLAAYVEEHGSFEWTDPGLSSAAAAETQELVDAALRRLRETS